MNENLIDKESQVKINFLKTQAERAFYLDEFKENVALALTEEQLRSGIVYPEIIERIKQSDVAYIKMKREIELKFLKPYIVEAERINVRYTLVDSLNLLGNIALVIVVKDAFDTNEREILIKDIREKFQEVGLYPEYVKYFGKKICEKHYSLVEEKLPGYEKNLKSWQFLISYLEKVVLYVRLKRRKIRDGRGF